MRNNSSLLHLFSVTQRTNMWSFATAVPASQVQLSVAFPHPLILQKCSAHPPLGEKVPRAPSKWRCALSAPEKSQPTQFEPSSNKGQFCHCVVSFSDTTKASAITEEMPIPHKCHRFFKYPPSKDIIWGECLCHVISYSNTEMTIPFIEGMGNASVQSAPTSQTLLVGLTTKLKAVNMEGEVSFPVCCELNTRIKVNKKMIREGVNRSEGLNGFLLHCSSRQAPSVHLNPLQNTSLHKGLWAHRGLSPSLVPCYLAVLLQILGRWPCPSCPVLGCC